MAMRRAQTRLLSSIVANARTERRSMIYSRNLHHQSGPTSQAALVDGQRSHTQDSLTSTALLSGSRANKKHFQELRDQQSDVIVKVYPTSVSLQSPTRGLVEEFHFDHVWLRDICSEANSVEKDTKQKLFHTSDIAIPSQDSTTGLLHE